MVTVSPEPTIVDDKWMYETGTTVELTANQYEGLVTFTNWSDGETASNNAAVQQILDEDYAGARKTLAAVAEPNATTAYLQAVVAARTNDREGVYAGLRTAVEKDASMKAKAAKDIEFAKFADDATFASIVK